MFIRNLELLARLNFMQASSVSGVILIGTGLTPQMLLDVGVEQWKVNSIIFE